MSTVQAIYYGADLPWSLSETDQRRFRRILLSVTLFFLVFGILVPLLPVSERERHESIAVPPRLARIIEMRKQEPPPAPEVRKIEAPPKPQQDVKPKPESAKKPPPKPEVKPKKVAKKPATKRKPVDPAAARKKASRAGILAMSDELASLRRGPAPGSLARTKLSKGAGAARKTTRAMVTANAGKGSGGINTASLSRDTGGTALRGGGGTARVSGPADTNGSGGASSRGKGRSSRGVSRDLERVQITFDRNKSAIYSIYNRALRKNPALQGKVVLKITIAPSGRVTACLVESSELGDSKLERKLLQRVKMIDFGAESVPPFTFTYPIDFFPA